jgi:fatty acid desaturase
MTTNESVQPTGTPRGARGQDDPYATVDRQAFAKDIDALRVEAEKDLSLEDYRHLRKMARWSTACTAAGYATGWIAPNLVSAALLSTGSMARWTIVVHHTVHKAMDRIEGVPERHTSRGFAKGDRRLVDWFDWLLPEAWDYEHNVLHHFRTSEVADPDLVEENAVSMRESALPMAVKYATVAFYALTWKLTYYAPNTFQILKRAARRRASGEKPPADPSTADARGDGTYREVFDPRTADGREFLSRCVLPYGGMRFGVIPMAFSLLGPWAGASTLANSIMAEAMTNAHTFTVIATNHAGDDLYRFDSQGKGRGEYYLRQVLSSVNFRTGGDLNDFMHGFLNYQIEHHLFPELPPRQYQKLAPKVKAVCEKHGVPYLQESVFKRLWQVVGIMVGTRTMRRPTAVA